MIACKVKEVKPFMQALLIGSLIDGWDVHEVRLHMRVSYTIDGHLNKAFLPEDDDQGNYSTWEDLKPTVAGLIRGKKTPTLLHIIVSLPSSFLTEVEADPEDQFLLNIHFENGTLTLITAMAHKSFTMDRTLDQYWDAYVPAYFTAHSIQLDAES